SKKYKNAQYPLLNLLTVPDGRGGACWRRFRPVRPTNKTNNGVVEPLSDDSKVTRASLIVRRCDFGIGKLEPGNVPERRKTGQESLARVVEVARLREMRPLSGIPRHRHQFVPVMIDRVVIGAPHVCPARNQCRLLAARSDDDPSGILIAGISVSRILLVPFHPGPHGCHAPNWFSVETH
ncbi:MAG: hypothetical protein OEW44_07065, partial [Gemmatimonadota bacterium]|nr:hypothetical protein [Gemmatimonadota bacterium]